MNKLKTIGFIGFGSFGQMFANGLSNKYKIIYYDPNINIKGKYSKVYSVELLAQSSDIIIIATPVNVFLDIINKISVLNVKNKLVVDILSTKVLANEIYSKYINNFDSILSLHPLFGPPSFKTFEPGMRIVVCKKYGNLANDFYSVLTNEYQFKLISKSAKVHDEHMAMHHALPFVLAHVLAKMDFNKNAGNLTIPTEEKLRRIVEIANNESDELYKSVVLANPYAKNVVDSLLKNINKEMHNLWG